MSNTQDNPEIGTRIQTGNVLTNYHDVGSGEPVLLIHGSGPGVSAWANWRLLLQSISDRYRLIAPDLAGFGYSEPGSGFSYSRENWLQQIVDLLDELKLERVHVVGNSFGGSMALALAIAYPERVKRLVLMGSVGVPFQLTPGLDMVWGYQPSIENMKKLLDVFAYSRALVTDELAELRYKASVRPGIQEAFASMFPAPRQRWVDAMAHDEGEIRALPHQTLLIHGRDDRVIPLATSLTLLDWIDNSQLHVFGHCGHWTQIEHARAFARLVAEFISEAAEEI